ncbi:MAG: 50S ribosomal protein L10 [Promethearchaeota archaeon]
MTETQIPQWKLDEVEKLIELFKKYANVAVINVAKINDKQFQSTRKLLRGKAVIKMSKKRLQTRAIEQFKKLSKKENLDNLAQNIPGQASLVFSNMEIFELKKIFEENKWMVPAKPGEITPVDIWIPAGDTGLPTGQVISELNMTLRLPTRIQNDTIWIRENTRTHKAGDFVNVKQASVLKKLGVNPLESIIKIHYAWSDGEIFPADVIYLDLEAFQKDIALAIAQAKQIAMKMGVIDDETIEPLMQKGHREALAILFKMPFIAEDMLEEYVKRAVLNANVINAMILGEGISVAPTQKEKPKKAEEPKPEEDDTDDEEVGIGGLFG